MKKMRRIGATRRMWLACGLTGHTALNYQTALDTKSPNRFFIEMSLGMTWLVATNDMKDAGDQNSLDAQSLRTINVCLPKCFA